MGKASQVRRLREYPIHRWRGPPSPMGKATKRGYRFSRHNAFPKGEGKEEAASPPKKRKPTPPRCARQPLPREGARVDTPSFHRKGRRLNGGNGMKKSEGDRLKLTINESTLSTAARSPFPNGEGCDTGMPLFSHRQNKYTHMWKRIPTDKAVPAWGRWRAKRAG